MDEKRYRVYLCGGPQCAAAGAGTLRRALEAAVWQQELDGDVELRDSGCQSRCEQGPNLTIWPGPHRYSGLTPELVRQIVARHLRDGEPFAGP